MKTFLLITTLILSASTSLASNFVCKTDGVVAVSVFGDSAELVFKGEVNTAGIIQVDENKTNSFGCQYELRI